MIVATHRTGVGINVLAIELVIKVILGLLGFREAALLFLSLRELESFESRPVFLGITLL
jgi:hypothetical protein